MPRITANDGSPILRLYEFERVRGVPYQIDFSLPPGSPWLLVTVRIVNPHDREIPMYWWSNIADPERPDVRTIAPADFAYNTGGWAMMKRVPIPRDAGGLDVTYSTHLPDATDYFYDIPANRRPWITALDADGKGLAHVSTPQLASRKMFAWGMNPGGRHWQEFLSVPNQPYLEIQAGVARTQFECFPMVARSELTWTEAYGLLEIDPKACPLSPTGTKPSPPWTIASTQSLAAANCERFANLLPQEILHHVFAGGWGRAVSHADKKAGESSMGAKPDCNSTKIHWANNSIPDHLLNHGVLPDADPSNPPTKLAAAKRMVRSPIAIHQQTQRRSVCPPASGRHALPSRPQIRSPASVGTSR